METELEEQRERTCKSLRSVTENRERESRLLNIAREGFKPTRKWGRMRGPPNANTTD